MIYKFFKADCAPCYAISRTLTALGIEDVVDIDVTLPENQDMLKEYGVDRVPTLIQKESRERLVGSVSMLQLRRFLGLPV